MKIAFKIVAMLLVLGCVAWWFCVTDKSLREELDTDNEEDV